MTVLTAPLKTDLITGEDLLAMGEIDTCELIDGRIVPRSPTGDEHGVIESNLVYELKKFTRLHELGQIRSGEVGIYIRRKPDTIQAADVAFVSGKRQRRPLKGFLEVAPELVVEIMSPSDRWQDTRSKLADYFSIGVERVWIVEPDRRTVLVYRSTTDLSEFGEGDVVQGEGVLQGFELPVADLFAEL